MRDNNALLELNFNSKEARDTFRTVMDELPSSIDLYLIGGSVRNALFREFHRTVLTQRDYDQVITSGSKTYTDYLKKSGFEERPYQKRQEEQTAYCKALNKHAQEGDSYVNWLVFDLHTVDGTTINDNIRNNVGFTINGCAIKGTDLFTKPWQDSVIEVFHTALEDIRQKRLRLNLDGYKQMPSNFFAMLRFMSVGFTPPPQHEVQLLLKETRNIDQSRYGYVTQKVWDYVGGEGKARKLVHDLGITVDVFDGVAVKSAFDIAATRP